METNHKCYNKHWPRKNLGEIVNFLEREYGGPISIIELADRIGITPQAVSVMFRKDDMRLSKAEEWARKFGYELKLYFPEEDPVWSHGESAIDVKKFPKAGNLKGLIKCIGCRNITINHMRQRINCSGQTLTKAFTEGDIKISLIYDIIENLHTEMIWEFNKKKQTN